MPTIRFVKARPPIEVAVGANLMEALLQHQVPVASSCRGDGVCGKCRIQITQGMENLSPVNPAENILRNRLSVGSSARISCQTQVFGDIWIDTSYW